MSSAIALADRAMQFNDAVSACDRSRRSTSKPSKSGNCMSTSTRSGRSIRARLTPSAPVPTDTMARSLRLATSSSTRSTLTGLSSMYRICQRLPPVPLLNASALCGASVRGWVDAPGSVTSNTVPCAAWLVTRIEPCMRSTSAFTMASPMPVPSMLSRSSPRRLKGSNNWPICSGVRPRPVSLTRSVRPSLAGRVSTRTSPCTRLYLMALVSRLISTWRKRVRSARTDPATEPVCTAMPCRRASGSTIGNTSATTSATSKVCRSSLSWPDCRLDRSSTSSISASRWSPAMRTWSMWARCTGSPRSWSRCSNWAKPSTAFSGVRSSWLMRARNSDFAALSRWAIKPSWRTASALTRSVTSQLTPM